MAFDNTYYFKNKLNEIFENNIKISFISKYYIIIITKEDKVYMFDENAINNSLLIFVDKSNNKSIIEKIIENKISESFNKELSNKSIIEIKSNMCITLARTFDGKLYIWGYNMNGSLGNGSVVLKMSNKPELMEFFKEKHIVEMCCGLKHSVVLTNDGSVYSWGDNMFGQVGNRKSGPFYCQTIPYYVNEFKGEKIKSIASGFYHSLVLTEGGRVYSWGYNDNRQLGRTTKNKNHSNCPKLIDLKEKVFFEKISCGPNHNLLLTPDGDIYVFGSNKNGVLGIKTRVHYQLQPTRLSNSLKFKDIATDLLHYFSSALCIDGLYYIWGCYEKEDLVKEPRQTHFKSFNEIFIHHLNITFTPMEGNFIEYRDNFIRNRYFDKEFSDHNLIGKGGYGEVFKVMNSNNPKSNYLNEQSTLENSIKYVRSGNVIKLANDAVKIIRDFEEDEKINYAIKTLKLKINKYEEEDDKTFCSILKELELFSVIRGLKHENLVEYFDLWFENEYSNFVNGSKLLVFIQMELCDKSLSNLMKEMKTDINLVENDCLTFLGYYISSEIFIQILEGVKYMHTRYPQMIHRDLKPDNILLKINPNNINVVKIADFGLTCLHKYVDNLSEPNTSNDREHTDDIGDVKYAAPEVLDGDKYDTKSDIYSLGIISKELFLLNDVRNTKISSNESNYKELIALQEIMTEKNPKQRPDIQQVLNDKNKWALTENDFNVKLNMKKFCEYCANDYKKSYIFDLIMKLSSKILSIHRYVSCDECNAFPIIGMRYKCNECEDYDLCESCFEKQNIHFKEHTFNKKIQNIHIHKDYENSFLNNVFNVFNKVFSPTINQNIECNECHTKPITGMRYQCNECENYNLCDLCIDKLNVHSEAHTFDSMADTLLGHFNINSNNYLTQIKDMLFQTANQNYKCKECHTIPISGIIYKCNECENYYLCHICIERTDTNHSLFKHTFTQFPILNIPLEEQFTENFSGCLPLKQQPFDSVSYEDFDLD